MTAPDLDALAGLLEQAQGVLPTAWHARVDNHGMWRVESAGELVCEGCTRAEAVAIAAAVNALPALLATARRERWYWEALAKIAQRDVAFPAVVTARAALAEEGQDVRMPNR